MLGFGWEILMAKPDHVFTCQACGVIWGEWQGKCDACGAWNTLVEEAARPVVPGALAAPTGKKGSKLAFVELSGDAEPPARLATGISEFDRVCGGGLVPASAILVGGDPGVGKSTLLLQAAAALAKRGHTVAYVTGEEAEAQVQDRARRLKAGDAPVSLAAETDLRKILDGLKAMKPDVVIVDSIQTLWADASMGEGGFSTNARDLALAAVNPRTPASNPGGARRAIPRRKGDYGPGVTWTGDDSERP